MAVPYIPEEELFRRLENWESTQASPPALWDVLRQGDVGIAAAYITRNFRIAAEEAVRSHERAQHLRRIAVEVFKDAEVAERFLRSPGLFLHRTPLEAAVESEAGLREALRSMKPRAGWGK